MIVKKNRKATLLWYHCCESCYSDKSKNHNRSKMHTTSTIKLKRNKLFPPQIPLVFFKRCLIVAYFQSQNTFNGGLSHHRDNFFAKCSNRILSDFPLAFPSLQKYHLKPFIFAKGNSVLLHIFTQTWKNLSKIRFTSIYPFLLLFTIGTDRVFFPLSWDFPLDVGGITGVQQIF